MDFVTKKALDAQLMKVKKPFKSSSGSQSTSVWVAFTETTSAKPQNSDLEDKAFHDNTECTFEEGPNNFPPLLNLCYIDKSILSDDAVTPVTWASRIFFWFVVLLFVNTAVAFFFMFLDRGSGWLRCLISAIATFLLSTYQLMVYETAFRGAYRTSMDLRRRYVLFSALNVPLIPFCSFIGVTFFSRWIGVQRIDTGESRVNFLARRLPVLVEFLGWIVLLISNAYTLFEYYRLYKSEAQGLSPSALEATSKANQAIEKQSRLEHSEAQDPKRAKVQEIRDRYGIQ